MSIVAVLLIALAVSDLVGGQLRHLGRWDRRIPAITGVAAVFGIAGLAGVYTLVGTILLVVAAATVAAWQMTCAQAFRAARRYWLPLVILGAGLTTLVLFSGSAEPVDGGVGRWMRWSDIAVFSQLDPTRAVLILGLALAQLSTANVVVRLVLSHVGALRPTGPQPADRLRGGRLLGPMERLIILGLGLAGQLTAASLVIAAKGLIRWPELQRVARAAEHTAGHPAFEPRTEDVTVDQVTEYFLVGSFVSWVIALAAIAVAAFA